jgi:hypothetical protein
LGFYFCDIKLWLSFQKKRKISQFTIGEKVAKKIPKFFFSENYKKNSANKKESTGLGPSGPLFQNNSGKKAKYCEKSSQ